MCKLIVRVTPEDEVQKTNFDEIMTSMKQMVSQIFNEPTEILQSMRGSYSSYCVVIYFVKYFFRRDFDIMSVFSKSWKHESKLVKYLRTEEDENSEFTQSEEDDVDITKFERMRSTTKGAVIIDDENLKKEEPKKTEAFSWSQYHTKRVLKEADISEILKHLPKNKINCYDDFTMNDFLRIFSNKSVQFDSITEEDAAVEKLENIFSRIYPKVYALLEIGNNCGYTRTKHTTFTKLEKPLQAIHTRDRCKAFIKKDGKYKCAGSTEVINKYIGTNDPDYTYDYIKNIPYYPDQAKKISPDVFNVFPGFKTWDKERKINPDLLEIFREYLRNVICGGDPKQLEFLDYCLAMIIGLGKRCGYVIGLCAQGGAGKSLLCEIIGEILGTDLFVCGSAVNDNLVGTFNINAKDKLVIVLEEIPTKGKSDFINDLKVMADKATASFTAKRQTSTVDNYENIGNYIANSNNPEGFEIRRGRDERKFFFPDISTDKIGNEAYFDKIAALKKNPEALLSIVNFYRNLSEPITKISKPPTKTLELIISETESSNAYNWFIQDYLSKSEDGNTFNSQEVLLENDTVFIPSSVIISIIKRDYMSEGFNTPSDKSISVKFEKQLKQSKIPFARDRKTMIKGEDPSRGFLFADKNIVKISK